MKIIIQITFFLLTVGLFSSCYYDVESELYPNKPACDTLNVTYKLTIKPILERNNCLNCHNTGLNSGGVNLDNYSSLAPTIASGKLLSSVNHDGKASKMPQGGAKIPDCDLKKIEIWIKNGAPDS
jgi:hypothetical protein